MSAIESAVKQLDVPRLDVIVHVRVLTAAPQGKTDVPADMQKVVRQREQSLRYGAYFQVAALTHRVRSGGRTGSAGDIELAAPVVTRPARFGYQLELRPLVTGNRKGTRTIQLRNLKFELRGHEAGTADIQTDVAVPEGETVVVGTAALGDRAMVLVFWALPV